MVSVLMRLFVWTEPHPGCDLNLFMILGQIKSLSIGNQFDVYGPDVKLRIGEMWILPSTKRSQNSLITWQDALAGS